MTEPTHQASKTKWRVTGTKIDSGEPVTFYAEARSAESARGVVARSGVNVLAVEPLAQVAPADYQTEPDLHHVHLETVRPGAAFVFGFFAFLGGLVAWGILGFIFALVYSLIHRN